MYYICVTLMCVRMKKYTILIAEDDESNYLYLMLLLRKHYNLLRAMNGREAVEIAERSKPDLILLDLKMPEMNGIEALRAIRQAGMAMPVIIQSSYAFEFDMRIAMENGASAYLTKPILRPNLFTALDELGLLHDELQPLKNK